MVIFFAADYVTAYEKLVIAGQWYQRVIRTEDSGVYIRSLASLVMSLFKANVSKTMLCSKLI